MSHLGDGVPAVAVLPSWPPAFLEASPISHSTVRACAGSSRQGRGKAASFLLPVFPARVEVTPREVFLGGRKRSNPANAAAKTALAAMEGKPLPPCPGTFIKRAFSHVLLVLHENPQQPKRFLLSSLAHRRAAPHSTTAGNSNLKEKCCFLYP